MKNAQAAAAASPAAAMKDAGLRVPANNASTRMMISAAPAITRSGAIAAQSPIGGVIAGLPLLTPRRVLPPRAHMSRAGSPRSCV